MARTLPLGLGAAQTMALGGSRGVSFRSLPPLWKGGVCTMYGEMVSFFSSLMFMVLFLQTYPTGEAGEIHHPREWLGTNPEAEVRRSPR